MILLQAKYWEEEGEVECIWKKWLVVDWFKVGVIFHSFYSREL